MFNEKVIEDLIDQNIIQDNIRRKQVAIENGLDENATWTDIANFHSEKQRKELIKKFNLKENATWRDISEYYSDIERVTAAYNKRPTKSEIEFDKFDYKANFKQDKNIDFDKANLTNPNVIFREVFKFNDKK